MFGIGLPEFILIMALALIVVGPEKLPDLAKTLAKQLLELKKTANALKDSLQAELKEAERPAGEDERSGGGTAAALPAAGTVGEEKVGDGHPVIDVEALPAGSACREAGKDAGGQAEKKS